jgi:outer membrane protein assembly factor BamB
MRLHAVIGSAALLVGSALAIFADDAGHIDYHLALVGLPKPDATLFQQPFAGSKASLIYSLSEKLVIGAVNPKDGELVWRQPLSTTGEGFLRAGEDQDTVISAAGDEVIAWSASDGRYVWSSKSAGSTVKDLEILELPDSKAAKGSKDAVVLLSGAIQGVKRLDGKTGTVKWTYEDARCVTLYLQFKSRD